jgi:hypothetical protein
LFAGIVKRLPFQPKDRIQILMKQLPESSKIKASRSCRVDSDTATEAPACGRLMTL